MKRMILISHNGITSFMQGNEHRLLFYSDGRYSMFSTSKSDLGRGLAGGMNPMGNVKGLAYRRHYEWRT